MKIATTVLTALAGSALAAGIFAVPAYADEAVAVGPTVDPGTAAGAPAPLPGNDMYAAQLPNGETYMVQLAPEQPLPPDAEEDDEMVVFWW